MTCALAKTVLLAIAVIVSAVADTSLGQKSNEPVILTQCGQTVKADEGVIEYKFEQPYDTDELCSFTIRTNTVADLVFTLESHGINATADPFAINIFTFDKTGLVESTHLGPPNPLTKAFVSGSIAVVVFQTNKVKGTSGSLGTGFRLRFAAVFSDAWYGISGQDVAYLNATGQEITIPFWENPGSNEVNVIVLSANGKAVTDVFKSMRVTFLKENLQKHINIEGCAYDAINIYSFVSKQIEHEQKFCSLLHHRSVYVTKGLMILVFRDFEASYWNNHEATFRWEINES